MQVLCRIKLSDLMRNVLLTAVLAFMAHTGLGQIIYVSTSDNSIYRLNLDNCTYDLVTQINRQIYDISFHPDGSLYGISGNGNFFSIDTLTGSINLIFDFDGQTFNSLTISADGLVYTIGDQGELWTFNLNTGVATYLGDIGFNATGDLAFYKGQLYAAVTGDRIVRIDLINPQNSVVVVNDNISGNILGIVSDVVDCTEINCYAISNGFSDIYKINFATGRFELICALNITVGGGASTTEFLGSSTFQIDTALLVQPNCLTPTGEATIVATGGFGALSYTMDGELPQDTNHFTSLSTGTYKVYVTDSRGCIDSVSFTLQPIVFPQIDTVILQPTTCGTDNGMLTAFASGGTGPLSYSIDSIQFQSTGIFASLGPARYQIYVVDSTGCVARDEALVDSLASAQIIRVDVTQTFCGEANGSMEIFTDPNNLVTYSIDGLNFQSNSVFEQLPANTYSVIIEDSTGCRDTLSIAIAPSESPTIDSISSLPENCGRSNGSLTIVASGGAGNYQYSLDGLSFQTTNTFNALSAGPYDVYIIDADGCTATSSEDVASTDALIITDLKTEASACSEATGMLQVEIDGATPPVMISLNNQQAQTDAVFTGLAYGSYLLLAVDANGCSVDTLVKIAHTGCPIYIPNIFSPNGDGVNDFFQLQTSDANEVTITRFFIFDRWGNEVYRKMNFPIHTTEGWWDGTYKHFTMNPGVFAYYLEVEYDNGLKETYRGNVTLIR